MSLGDVLRSPRLHLGLRLLLGLIFVWASLPKIADPPAFARIVYQWQVLPPVPANVLAVMLPWVELLAGLLLIAGVWKKDAALLVAVLLLVFLGAATYILAHDIDVENCGCTSVATTAPDTASSPWPPAWTRGVGWFLVTRNLVLLGAALVIAVLDPREREPVASTVRASA